MVILTACSEEDPNPGNFIEYDYPQNHRLNAVILSELDEQIRNGRFGAINSLVIIKDDHIIFENYYNKYSRKDLHALETATQSVLSMLSGTVISDSLLELNDHIIDFFPEYNEFFENIPQKDQIRVRDLLSHRSGLWWDELTHPFGDLENDAYNMTLSDDWVGNVLSTPMIREPGQEFNFNSGNAIVVGPILEKASGKNMEELAVESLFEPLGIEEWEWDLTPSGQINTSWGLSLKPVDMAKIGYLFLQNGYWDDELILSERWIRSSTRPRANVSNYFNYGFFWWRFTGNADALRSLRDNDVFFSWGTGGQFIFVIPHVNMVVVSTASNYNDDDFRTVEMLRDFIFPSIVYGFN